MEKIVLILFVYVAFLSGCRENPTEPQPIKQKILITNEVVFFSSDRDGKATNIFMMATDGEYVKQITKYGWGEFAATAISPDSNQLLFYQAAPGLDIDVGMDIYIYKIKEDTVIGPITQGHPGNFSPDGNKFVFSRHTFTMGGGYESIYLYDLRYNSEIKLTEDGKTCFYPQISPNGNNICYESAKFWDRDSISCWQLHMMDINGNNITDLTSLKNAYYASNPVFTPDGRSIIFWYNEQTWCYDVCKLDLSNHSISYVTKNRFNGRYDITSNYKNPSVSKASNKVYFYSDNVYGDYPHPIEIYSANLDGSDLRKLTQNNFWDSHPVAGVVYYYVKE